MENFGVGVDRAVGLVAKEVVATYAATSAGFGQVGGVTLEVHDHVTGAIADGGIGVGRSIIQELNGCVMFFLRCFRLLESNGADGNEHGRVDEDIVIE